MNQFYIKVGKKYKKIPHPDWNGFPCEGVWLVQNKKHCKSSECILRLGELPELYPFASMAMNKDGLAKFIHDWYEGQKNNNPEYDKNGKLISYTVKSNSDLAGDILKFLARTVNDDNI